MPAAKPIYNAIKRIAGEAARDLDQPVLKKISSWLMGETVDRPQLEAIYRGVPKGSEKIAPESAEYIHGTPWASVASRGGKGAFGDPHQYDVLAFPVRKETKFYRGGSLEGDPLERTRIDTTKGALWDEALDNAKETYMKEVIRRKAQIQKRYSDSPYLNKELELIPKHAAEDITHDLMRGTFETDLGGKPGIWEGQHVPHKLARDLPKLRSYDDLEDALIEKKKIGYPLEDIVASPEAKILRRGQPDRFKDLLEMVLRK
jgi:hypothetical protein